MPFQAVTDIFLLQQPVYIGFVEVCDEQRTPYGRFFQIKAVGFQHPRRILFRVRVSQKEQEVFLGDVAVYYLHVYVVHRAEMTVIAVIDGRNAVGGNVQGFADAVAFVVGDGNDFPAFLQNPWYGEAAVVPPHFLIKRGTALLAGVQIDDVVECQHQRNRTAERGCVGCAMQQVCP